VPAEPVVITVGVALAYHLSGHLPDRARSLDRRVRPGSPAGGGRMGSRSARLRDAGLQRLKSS
jgi:hypothetical protein